MKIRPVGVVRRVSDEECELIIESRFLEGLLGVGRGTRLDVLYWMHELSPESREILQCHPRGDRSKPARGVFALRSPMRPNPIGVTSVEVLEIDGAILRVSGLDAMDGSPIVDIKAART